MDTLLLNMKWKLCEVICVDIVVRKFLHESMQYKLSFWQQ